MRWFDLYKAKQDYVRMFNDFIGTDKKNKQLVDKYKFPGHVAH